VVKLRTPSQSSGGAAAGTPRSKSEHAGSHRPSHGWISSGGPREKLYELLLNEYVSEQPMPRNVLPCTDGVHAPQPNSLAAEYPCLTELRSEICSKRPSFSRAIRNAMNGWSGSIAACQGTSTVPRLHAIVAKATAFVPLGKLPARATASISSIQ
jgi:hypothetical protein